MGEETNNTLGGSQSPLALAALLDKKPKNPSPKNYIENNLVMIDLAIAKGHRKEDILTAIKADGVKIGSVDYLNALLKKAREKKSPQAGVIATPEKSNEVSVVESVSETTPAKPLIARPERIEPFNTSFEEVKIGQTNVSAAVAEHSSKQRMAEDLMSKKK